MRRIAGRCPICGQLMRITQMECQGCGTRVEGEFELCDFCRLSEEMFALLEVFLSTRGNVKQMEQELGISYPTVRSRVDRLLEALGVAEENRRKIRGRILDLLDEGQISASEAARLLRSV